MLKLLGERMSEPQTKFLTLVLLFLGGFASVAGSEAVLPAYLVGMVLAPTFLRDQELAQADAHHRLLAADAVLFPQGRIAGGRHMPCSPRAG